MKKAMLLILLAGLATNAFATDFCGDPAVRENVTQGLSQIRGIADKAGLAYTTAQVATCNSTTMVKLAYPNTNLCTPQNRTNCVQITDGCGALFTFSNRDDMQKFATTMMYKLREVMGVCVQVDRGN